jgi:NAD(P)-dependent dehydrogenase (short-subunit alcohol dehydrogenase family)
MTNFCVTGANRGIGLELTKQLLKRGDTVVATARDLDRATELKALADKHKGKIDLFGLDVTSDQSVKAFASAMGPRAIDVLINNAGTIGGKPQTPSAMNFDDFLETLNTNTVGPLRVIQALMPNLKSAALPKIVTISSMMGSMASAQSDTLAYRVSKAGVNKVMQAVDTDMRRQGVAVLTLHPGWVRTDMGGAGADIAPEESASGIIARIDDLSVENSGRFLDYDGSTRSW